MRDFLNVLYAVAPPLGLLFCALFLAVVGPTWVVPFVIIFDVIMVADIRARLIEYSRLLTLLHYKRTITANAVIERMRQSWCQRHAAEAACRAAGMPGHAARWYELHGYRWYHIFPDGIFQRDSALLKWSFWRSVLGLRLRG